MNCEVLCIGTELLHGDIVNSNAAYISKCLAHIGIDVHYHSVVGDNPERMREAFNLAASRADLIICTGGLGPTKDDITKYAAADFFGVSMVFDKDSKEHIEKRFAKMNRKMTDNNLRQAYFPEGVIILDNKNGTANACIIDKVVDDKRKICVLLPGPPIEMSPLMDENVIPYLKKISNMVVCHKKVTVVNVGESTAETMIMDLIDNQTNPTIAPYCSTGKVVFRVTAKADSEEHAFGMIDPVVNELLRRFGDDAFVMESDSVQDYVCSMLLKKGLTVSTAESCTGGLVASTLVGYPGISKIFKEGFVTYSNEAKMNVLGVSKATIDEFTEVSMETAKEMAYNAARLAGSDIGISTTGIAGPTGAFANKPVGLVYMCVYYKGKYIGDSRVYSGSRNKVREQAALYTMELVRRAIK